MRRIALAMMMMLGVARAEPEKIPIAMLPFDADAKLEIYAQPLANEIAHQLTAGGYDVVVVGAKMTVPDKAHIVVDGTIKMAKGDAVTLVARIRDPHEPTASIDTLVVEATLTTMDHAVDDVVAKVLPKVKARVEKLQKKDEPVADKHPGPPQPPPLRPMLAAFAADPALGTAGEPLRAALAAEVVPWAQRRHHEARVVDMTGVEPKTVAAANADLSLACHVRAVDVEIVDGVPLAKATVQVRVADGAKVVWDRVIVTDTIVGDKNLAPDRMAARIARAVLQIAEPHVRRAIAAWE